jgi:hypothetical protein
MVPLPPSDHQRLDYLLGRADGLLAAAELVLGTPVATKLMEDVEQYIAAARSIDRGEVEGRA